MNRKTRRLFLGMFIVVYVTTLHILGVNGVAIGINPVILSIAKWGAMGFAFGILFFSIKKIKK